MESLDALATRLELDRQRQELRTMLPQLSEQVIEVLLVGRITHEMERSRSGRPGPRPDGDEEQVVRDRATTPNPSTRSTAADVLGMYGHLNPPSAPMELAPSFTGMSRVTSTASGDHRFEVDLSQGAPSYASAAAASRLQHAAFHTQNWAAGGEHGPVTDRLFNPASLDIGVSAQEYLNQHVDSDLSNPRLALHGRHHSDASSSYMPHPPNSTFDLGDRQAAPLTHQTSVSSVGSVCGDGSVCGGMGMLRVMSASGADGARIHEQGSSDVRFSAALPPAASTELQEGSLRHDVRFTGGDGVGAGRPVAAPSSTMGAAVPLARTASTESAKSGSSSSSERAAKRRMKHLAASNRPIAPAVNTSSLTPELPRVTARRNSNRRVPLSQRPRTSGPAQKRMCPQCNDKPDGFRGEHELNRHMSREHGATKKLWYCVDISPDKTFLRGCKRCESQKAYNADYNAAAHLRRTHFHPRQARASDGTSQPRGGRSGGLEPPMEEIRPWLHSVEVPVDHADAIADEEPEPDSAVAMSWPPMSDPFATASLERAPAPQHTQHTQHNQHNQHNQQLAWPAMGQGHVGQANMDPDDDDDDDDGGAGDCSMIASAATLRGLPHFANPLYSAVDSEQQSMSSSSSHADSSSLLDSFQEFQFDMHFDPDYTSDPYT